MRFRLTLVVLLIGCASASAQTPPAPIPQPKPAETAASVPAKAIAKELFGGQAQPAPLQARSIGFYAHGCLAGAVALPVDGKTWQGMRLTRNRHWGHPGFVRFL